MPEPDPSVDLDLRTVAGVVRLSVGDEALRREAARLWRPMLHTTSAVEPDQQFTVRAQPTGWTLERGGTEVLSSADPREVLSALATQVNGAVLESCAHLAVHAGAVARDGLVVVWPAESGTGKSTLTAACVVRGWDYVSDEALVIDASGQVLTYPKPLALSGWAITAMRLASGKRGDEERQFSVDDLGGRPAQGPLALAEVLLLERTADPGPPRLVAEHRSLVLHELLRSSFNHYKQAERSIELLASVAQSARCWRLRYHDAVEAAELITETFPDRAASGG